MCFYREMAFKYGLKLYMSECLEVPGEIIYEDAFQIAVKKQYPAVQIETHEIKP